MEEAIKINGENVEAYYGQAHKYKMSLALISKVGTRARILDVGGGDRHLKLPNFLNLDIKRNCESIDVVGDAQNMPFRNGVFDLVLCESVMEHIPKPWLAAEETYRIIKNEGLIFVDVPFICPVHGRPHHYFNMTEEGVKTLFERFRKIESGVPKYEMPSLALTMILSRYIRCLVPSIDRSVKQAEVYDSGTFISQPSQRASFLVMLFRGLTKFLQNFDRFINPEKAQEIAAGVYFIGKKIEQESMREIEN
jgi:ubiquinone/menaquinone biosynthesis C-methylase UbiE